MSYLVLARKWRPKRFSELVGQEHVVRALGNALDSGRVHHAFLFTGTRGVGKTTIARIFAKSLNCEQGTSADPCGQCAACQDIDAGRYIDLLEIDAASNTGVDDVREVIENAQYMPSRGRYKVYLVDEVHMLSKAAFNALLKTLEEPPEHVKFLLATTDPQKLPITVLSRCLQFNLKRLDEGQIEGQMTKILAAEGIEAEAGAIRQLARAADGSLRDGLSLLDQAIAYAGGALTEAAVQAMLGSVDRTQVAALLDALAVGDGKRLLDTVEVLAGFAPDWSSVLEAVAEALHRIQVRQLVPAAAREDEGIDTARYAARLRPEVIQLWYQMAVNGRRDLDLAPAPRVGFEMTVLRMLAFRPEADAGGPPATGASQPGSGADAGGNGGGVRAAPAAPAFPEPVKAAPALPARPDLPPWETPAPATAHDAADEPARPTSGGVPPAAVRTLRADIVMPAPRTPGPAAPALPAEAGLQRGAEPARPVPAPVPAPEPVPAPPPPEPEPEPEPERGLAPAAGGVVVADGEDWLARVAACELTGPARQLAERTAFVSHADGVLTLALEPGFEYLRSERSISALAQAMAASLGVAPKIVVQEASGQVQTLHQRHAHERDARQAAAEETFLNDPGVRRLIEHYGARVVSDSIRPSDE